ncbi:MAG: hypothetical protein ACE5DW_03000 [Thermodesulfobacteriota bacterium]
MKSKLAILLSILIVPLLLATTNVQAAGGSGGYADTSSEGYLVDAFGFPPYGTSRIFRFCAVDTYGALWHLTASSGTITGTRDNLSNCIWNINGNYTGANFHMNLTLTSGSSCCTSGYTDGTASKRSRTATGDTYWTGSCGNSGPWAYTWTKCP